jgi:ribosomal protein S18 acetylase RimI-like enzyme
MTTSMNLHGTLKKYVDDCRTFPADAGAAYQRDGLRAVWKVLARRTVYRVLRAGHLIVYSQSVADAPDVGPPPGVTIALLKDSDWPALAGLVTARDLLRFRALVAAGRYCLVAWRGSEPVGYGWVAEGLGSDVTLCQFPLPHDAAYLFDLYVLPAERGSGVGSALACARIQTARARGFREGWRTIAPSNGASLRTLRKTGNTCVMGELWYIKVLSRTFVRYTPTPACRKEIS